MYRRPILTGGFVVFAAGMLAALGPAQANLITNGGFETGDFTGWTTGANSYPEYIATSPVHSGTYAAQIAGYSYNPDTLSQTVTDSSGQNYDLSFWRYQSNGGPTILLNVYWDGTLVFHEFDTGAQPYQQFTANVAGTGSDTLLFQSANDPGLTFLDDVSLTPSAVPIPTALPLFAGGVGAFGLFSRWRRRRNPATTALAAI